MKLPAASSDLMRLRLLVDVEIEGMRYRANQVIDVDQVKGDLLLRIGQADNSKAAIAYAESLSKNEPIQHAGPADDVGEFIA
jgi:hypothetical protein